MVVLRALGVFVLAILTFFCALIVFMPVNTEINRSSLAKQQEILADLQKMGRFTEAWREREGTLPTTEDLHAWMETQSFQFRVFDSYKGDPRPAAFSLAVMRSGEEFFFGDDGESELPTDDGHTYRIVFWDDWAHEYAPETGSHTLPTSLEDYAPEMLQRALYALLAVGFLVLIAKLLGLLPQKEEMA